MKNYIKPELCIETLEANVAIAVDLPLGAEEVELSIPNGEIWDIWDDGK